MSTSTLISSPQNPKVQLVRALMNQNKARQKHQALWLKASGLEDGLKSEMPVKFILQKENLPSGRDFLSTVNPEQWKSWLLRTSFLIH